MSSGILVELHKFGHGDGLRVGIRDPPDFIASLNHSFLKYGQVKSISPAIVKGFDEFFLAHRDPQFEAWKARLSHPKACRADLQLIADGDFSIEQSIDG